MNTALSLGILGPIIIIAIIIGIVITIINLFRKKEDKLTNTTDSIQAYFYFIIFITKFMIIGSVAGLLAYILSELFELFSGFNSAGEVITSIATIVIMGLIMAGHLVGLNYYSKKHSTKNISKQFNIISLVVYSVLSIFFIVTTIGEFSYLFSYENYGFASVPAQPIGWTIALLPVWTYFLIQVVTSLDDDNVKENSEEQKKAKK